MHWYKPSKLQVFSFLAYMPVLDIICHYILFDQVFFKRVDLWLFSFPLVYATGALAWVSHYSIQNFFQRRLPGVYQTRLRILLLTFFALPSLAVWIFATFFLYRQFHLFGYVPQQQDYLFGLVAGFCISLVFTTLYEVDYVLERFKQGKMANELLKQQSLQREFAALKNQVNPHFLFNCFNTLSSLIREDKKRSLSFLDELSKVYRYLLRNNEDGLSTVENEVKFIRSYYDLLKNRHGEAIQLTLSIDDRYKPYLLPSSSLQLLVENAVKHNQLSRSRPLVIEIFTVATNKLVVNNNLQRRAMQPPGNRIGLENIKTKYQLLDQAGFHVLNDGKNFSVILPLIWNNPASLTKINHIQNPNPTYENIDS